MLTDREKALMKEAYEAGYGQAKFEDDDEGMRINESLFGYWLDDSAADGVTVEMVLDKEFPG